MTTAPALAAIEQLEQVLPSGAAEGGRPWHGADLKKWLVLSSLLADFRALASRVAA
jgi:hypothetical protein